MDGCFPARASQGFWGLNLKVRLQASLPMAHGPYEMLYKPYSQP